ASPATAPHRRSCADGNPGLANGTSGPRRTSPPSWDTATTATAGARRGVPPPVKTAAPEDRGPPLASKEAITRIAWDRAAGLSRDYARGWAAGVGGGSPWGGRW